MQGSNPCPGNIERKVMCFGKKRWHCKEFFLFVYLNFLNLIDCLITVLVISHFQDFSIEKNPIMRFLIEISFTSFTITKLLGVLLISWWLYGKKENQLAAYGIYFLSIIYTFVIGSWIFCFIGV